MPQATQIAPKWLHPHVMTVINDNTVYEENTTTVDTNVKFLAVFASGQGPDNVLVKKTDLADFKTTFGDSDYAKYGQPLLMPLAELKAGNASVYCMRVMPEDATYANVMVSALYRKISEPVNILEYDEDGNPLLDDNDEPVYRTVNKVITKDEYAEIAKNEKALKDPDGVAIYEAVKDDNDNITGYLQRALNSANKVITRTTTMADGETVTTYEYVQVKPTATKLQIKYYTSFVNHGYVRSIDADGNEIHETPDDSESPVVTEWVAGAINKDVLSTAFGKLAINFEDGKLPNNKKINAGLKEGEPAWTAVPLFYINMTGRGMYGNNFRFRISPDTAYEKDYGIKFYSFEVINTTNGISKVANYLGTLVTSKKFSETTFITDVMLDRDAGDSYFDITVDEAAVETLYNAYVEVLTEATVAGVKGVPVPDLDEFDPIFGNIVGEQYKASFIEIIGQDEKDPNVYSLDATIGVPLLGGSDGIFANDVAETAAEVADAIAKAEAAAAGRPYQQMTKAEAEAINTRSIEDALTDAYIKAFSGQFDVTIMAPRRTPLNIMLDANYPLEVKRTMYELAGVREDCMVVLDSGIIDNRLQINQAIKNLKDMNERYATKEFQHYQVRDPKTNKRVTVTTTYKWATDFAFHVKTYGNHIPFVKSYATLTGHIKNSLAPSIELTTTDSALKEKLYNARFNYYETIADNTFARATQNTAQNINSDLLEENNMRTLFDLKNQLEEDCWNNLYNFADPNDRAAFTQVEMAKFSSWVGSRVLSLDIYFDMNEWEAERSILHCYVAVVFRQLNKRTIIEIDVNKRS